MDLCSRECLRNALSGDQFLDLCDQALLHRSGTSTPRNSQDSRVDSAAITERFCTSFPIPTWIEKSSGESVRRIVKARSAVTMSLRMPPFWAWITRPIGAGADWVLYPWDRSVSSIRCAKWGEVPVLSLEPQHSFCDHGLPSRTRRRHRLSNFRGNRSSPESPEDCGRLPGTGRGAQDITGIDSAVVGLFLSGLRAVGQVTVSRSPEGVGHGL